MRNSANKWIGNTAATITRVQPRLDHGVARIAGFTSTTPAWTRLARMNEVVRPLCDTNPSPVPARMAESGWRLTPAIVVRSFDPAIAPRLRVTILIPKNRIPSPARSS